MTATRFSAKYRWSHVALLRASTDPGGLDLPDGLLRGEDNEARGWTWLSALWQRPEVRAALGTASPALARQVDDLVSDGDRRDARSMRRILLSVASYVLRWQRRPTPFGLFAGVAVARIGAGTKVRWGSEHRVAVRADASWLGDVLARLHRCSQLRDRLSVVTNNTGTVRGDRFVASGPAPAEPAGGLAPIEVSVRLTRPVRAALDAAREPMRFGDLRTALLHQFPTATTPQIDGLLTGLLDQGLLISNLRAPMTCLDALGHACAQLEAVDAHIIPETRGTVRELSAIHQELRGKRPASAATSVVTERMRALSEAAEMPLVVDTIPDCDVRIPDQVAREACAAVEVLHRLSPYPWGYPAWRDYHTRFRTRYGTGAVVPVLELTADSGLGFPADYLGSAHGRAPRQVSERDEKLLALIQRATFDGNGEIVLTDRLLDDLTAGDRTATVHLPPRVEVAVEIRAQSIEALTRGRFALTVTGTPRPGSSMAGRHLHLVPDDDRALIADTFAATEPGVVAAQLSFGPRKQRNNNVARTEQVLPHVISVAEYHEPHPHLIQLADLAVTVDEHRFYLLQLSTGRRVEPRVTHALEAGVHTPPLGRFLAEITTARSGVYKAFHFGAASRLPYLPRIRYRRTTLSPARWLLTEGDLPGRAAPMAEWTAGLGSWRARWRVPEHVALVDHDRRQPVDLSYPLDRELLRTRLQRAGRIELRETAYPHEFGWLGRAHELLVLLVRDTTAHTPAVTSPPARAVARDDAHLPGHATVLCAQLYGHPGRFDDILTERLPGLLEALDDQLHCWWFRRHREMRRPELDQYLAVYLRLRAPSAYGPVAERLAAWSGDLRRDRLLAHLTLATHAPQTGRYGHGPVLDRAYDAFAADSTAVLAQIRLARRAGVHPQALAAASSVDLAVHFAGDTDAGLTWLARELPQEHGRLDPALRDQTLELADPHATATVLRSVPKGRDVLTAWGTRAAALRAYREELAEQRNPLPVLRSLLHLHHLRALGADPAAERVTARLARACALRHLARHTET